MGLQSQQLPVETSTEAEKRLLEAWRGEVEAGLVYDLLARRQRDQRRVDLIRQIAVTEAKHHQRIEARLAELGIPIPDPASFSLSRWRRWQMERAPVERVLASREAAAKFEAEDRYARPTGDTMTDTLRGESASQSALDRLLHQEKGHAQGTGWILGAIYGANDGLAAVFGIVTGVSGATGASSFVLTAGLAGAIASALSMATGAFLAERSEAEVAQANLGRECREIEEHPEEEEGDQSAVAEVTLVGQPIATWRLHVSRSGPEPARDGNEAIGSMRGQADAGLLTA